MMSLEQPVKLNLRTIFLENEYVIPIYQRNYAWGEGQIKQLLTDIYDSTGNYYIGSLIVNETAPKIFSVIDGQQRLTTLFLLLSFLKDESITSHSLRFEAREKSNLTLKSLFDHMSLDRDEFYSNEIVEGFNIIKSFFDNAQSKNKEYIQNFKSKLPNILIIRTQVPKQIDLNHYFEIMNTRGEQLEIHEIAKGKILSVIERDTPEYRNVSALIWEKCSQMDSYIQMNFDKSSRKRLFGDTWDNFCCSSIVDLKSCIVIDKENEEKRFSLFDKLENPVFKEEVKQDDDYENERFESIISFPNFLLIVNEALQKKNGEDDASLDDKRILETLSPHWKNGKAASNFVFNMLKLRFLFDKYVIKREYAKDYKEDGKWSLQRLQMYYDKSRKQEKPSYKLTYAIGEDETDKKTERLRCLQSALRITYTSPKTMHWVSRLLATLNESEESDLTKLLEDYACCKIEDSDYKNSTGFGIDRIVFTYLDYIIDRDSLCSIPNFQFQFRTSIEHFYPQHPIEKEIWDAKSLNCLGNLALITVSSNSRFSNLDPQSKVSSYPETIRQSPKLKLMSEMMKSNGNVWNQQLAKTHEVEMMKLLSDEIEKHGRRD